MTDDPRAGSAKLGMVLAMWAEHQPDVPAVLSEFGDRSFAELNANVNRLSRALRRRGVGQGTSVALLCSNRPEFVESFAATQRCGLRVTPVDNRPRACIGVTGTRSATSGTSTRMAGCS